MNLEKSDYTLILGTSHMGKTTEAKTLVKDLKDRKQYKCLVHDPHRHWQDLADKEVEIPDLNDVIGRIAKPLLFEKSNGILVIEDLGLMLENLQKAMGISLNKAKGKINIVLENARKYGLKVLVIAHRLKGEEIDETTFKQFDTYVIFNTPLTNYGKKLISLLNIDFKEVEKMGRYHYIALNKNHNNGKAEEGDVVELESHTKIENDKNFQITQVLFNCHSTSQKVLALRKQLNLSNKRIAELLGKSENHIKVILSRWRDRGVNIQDGRRVEVEKLLV